ncbi:MAG: argininosuccinate lyase, partial [Atopobiaceae bacterium]|nr:argininosuccinate lyase [Atopobiaceae bacterium]
MALWGGRFEGGVDAFTQEFGASLEVDKNMAQQDIRGSIAHATMLAEQGVISDEDRQSIVAGLTQISSEIEAGTFVWDINDEDV